MAVTFPYIACPRGMVSQMTPGAVSQLAHDAVSAINKEDPFENDSCFRMMGLFDRHHVYHPHQALFLEYLVTGLSLSHPEMIDPARIGRYLRFLERDGGLLYYDQLNVQMPESTWGATKWPQSRRTSYFESGLALFFVIKFRKEGASTGHVSLIASYLKAFAHAGSMTWPRHAALPPSASQAIEIYDIARQKGATNAEIAEMANQISASWPRR